MPLLSTKRHSISNASDLGFRHESDPHVVNDSIVSPTRRLESLCSARGANFVFNDRPARDLHQDNNTYDALVGKRDQPLVGPDTVGTNGGFLPPTETKSPAQLYEDQYRTRPSQIPPFRERVIKHTPVVAHLRTNVIVKDEYSLVTDLSHHLSVRYSKPQSAIMITLDHSVCLLLGATFEPAYVLTITALPSELQSENNRQNVAYIQSFLASVLGVSPDRGIMRFVAIIEDNLATNGTTMSGAIDRMHRAQKMRHSSVGGLGDGSKPRHSARNSMPARPRTMLDLLEDAEVAERRDSSIVQDTSKRWLPLPVVQDEARASDRDPRTESPSPVRSSPRLDPLTSNPPPRALEKEIPLDWRPVQIAPSRPPSADVTRKLQKRQSGIVTRRTSSSGTAHRNSLRSKRESSPPVSRSSAGSTDATPPDIRWQRPSPRKLGKRLSILSAFRSKVSL